jgi:hypothetical protein
MYLRENLVGLCRLDTSSSGKGSVEGSCENGNEPLSCIKGGELLDQPNEYQLLKKGSAAWE